MNPIKLFIATICSLSTGFTTKPPQSIYNLSIKSISNETIDLGQYKDKYILFVNVASKCGFTKQYNDLQKLHETYKDRIVVIGLPCNQFGKQEPGNAKTIQEFCSVNYGVNFPITEKIEVKAANQHPIYQWLTSKAANGSKDSSVKWNFQKYLVNPNGELVDFYYSTTNPLSNKITKYLQ